MIEKNSFIPLSIPNFEGNERKYVDDAVDKAWVSTGGAYVAALEEKMADFLSVAEVACCQSGTAAIHLAMVDAGIEPEDVVIVPTLTFIAAVNPVMYMHAEPVFMDCDDSLCMDPVKLKRFCEEECCFENDALMYKGKRVRAVVVVHVFGNMADMESIIDIADEYNLVVIEDATEALGTCYAEGRYSGEKAGTIGDYGAFSFNGNKIITTGGGGAVTAKDAGRVKHIRYLSTQAKDDPKYYIHDEVGYNYRMTNVQAALGVAQMEELDEFIECKRRNYDLYRKLLKDVVAVKLLPFRDGTYSNKWFYSLVIDTKTLDISLREVVDFFENDGIQTRAIWGLIHEQKPYLRFDSYDIVRAKYYSENVLNLPCSTNLTEEDVVRVVERIKFLVKEADYA